MAATLPERIALARREQLDYASFLETILSDEVNRRAGVNYPGPSAVGRRLLPGVSRQARARAAGGTRWRRQELPGSGIGLRCHPRRTHRPLRPRRDFFKAMAQARVDNSTDRSFLTPDLLILDDLGLHRLTAQQSADLYELILNRHRSSSFVITSSRAVDEWLSLFDDPILGNSPGPLGQRQLPDRH